MVNVTVVFWTFVILIAFIGASRGWVREVILTFSIIFALFVLRFFDERGLITNFIASNQLAPQTAWLVRALPFLVITMFGYLGPAVARAKVSNASGKFEEGLLSTLVGAFNGYLIFSSLVYFAREAGILAGEFRAGGTLIFTPPAGGWESYWFVANAAPTLFTFNALIIILIILVLFVLIVVI